MNPIKRLIGAVADKIHSARIQYLQEKNSSSVNNRGSVISGNCVVVYPANIYIGENSYVNGGLLQASPNAKITIGDNCLISYNVHLRTDMHNYIDRNTLIREQGHTEKDITIGNDVWIGYGAQIMAGVSVADGCVIAAGAVVTHDTEEYGVYAGVPARRIKERKVI